MIEWILVIAFGIVGNVDAGHSAGLKGFKTEAACNAVKKQVFLEPMKSGMKGRVSCVPYKPDKVKI